MSPNVFFVAKINIRPWGKTGYIGKYMHIAQNGGSLIIFMGSPPKEKKVGAKKVKGVLHVCKRTGAGR